MAHIHGVYDTDTHFLVDPVKKELTVAEGYEKVKVIQHDHNSERFTFEMPRYIEGHDMSTCNKVEVHYLNVDSKTKEESKGLYPVDDLQISPENEDIVICSWLISGNATKYVGTLFFVLRLECNTEGTIDYAFNTLIYEKISVGKGIYNSEAIATEYADVLEKWKKELVDAGSLSEDDIAEAVAKYMEKNPIVTEETDPTVPAWAKEPTKPTYTAEEVGADPTGTAESKVSTHNVATDSHNDIRLLIEGLTTRLNALADSDDTTLDQMSEIVAYIKSNKDLIDAITTNKVSVSDIVDNLTTNVSNKPLSASQGVALKALIDAIVVPTTLPNPNALTFTGAVTGSYDGSKMLSIEIPSGGTIENWELLRTITIDSENASNFFSFDVKDDGTSFECNEILIIIENCTIELTAWKSVFDKITISGEDKFASVYMTFSANKKAIMKVTYEKGVGYMINAGGQDVNEDWTLTETTMRTIRALTLYLQATPTEGTIIRFYGRKIA